MREIFHSHEVLDADGRHLNGTDKEGPNHSYGDAYERLFTDRDKVTLMMEIGVADGSSLCAWRDIFPNATCVGVDIHPSVRASGPRIEFYLGDMRRRMDCLDAAGGRWFDLIVDDATHHLSDTLCALYWLWPHVKSGGLYVVEEWDGVAGDRARIAALWPGAEVIGTCGPHVDDEPLVVFRKPIYGPSPLAGAYGPWREMQR